MTLAWILLLRPSDIRDAGSSIRLMEAAKRWKPSLKLVANSTTRRSEIRAAAFAALGLLTRDERRSREKDEAIKRVFWRSVEPEVLLHAEMDLYRSALDLEESSVIHCYFAECLISAGLS